MNRSFLVSIIMLCSIILGAFGADAGSLIEGDNFQVSLEINTIVKPPDLEPKFTKESSYCIANQTTTDFSVFIDDVSVVVRKAAFHAAFAKASLHQSQVPGQLVIFKRVVQMHGISTGKGEDKQGKKRTSQR